MARRGWLVIGVGALLLAALVCGATAARGDATGPPVSTDLPTVSGLPAVGKTLRTTSGSWSTSATFTYQWLRCGKGFRGCTADDPSTYTVIVGATAATYKLVDADVGHVVLARVTATNAAGSASVFSSGDGPVEAKPPEAKEKPWIRGAKRVGQRIYVTGPGWTHSPYMFTYQWLRCSAEGNDCVRITGKHRPCSSCLPAPVGTDSEYKLTKKDVGHRLRIRADAWNGAGRGTSTSNPTPIIKG